LGVGTGKTVMSIITGKWVAEAGGPGRCRPLEGQLEGKDREVGLEGSNEVPDYVWGVVSSGSRGH